jgi:hypothetical protein
MATTTTNFGWDIPQSTDLVKDGATAIAALGQDIDTALVDLKGGTTGQVLAKASGTDLDFSWVAQDDSNAIQNAIVDAKGDLIGATAADTPARLAVGTDGQVLTADSTAATGLKWAASTGNGWTLASTTTLSGSSTSISIPTGYKEIRIFVENWQILTTAALPAFQFNSVTTSTYRNLTTHLYNATTTGIAGNTTTSFQIGAGGTNTTGNNANMVVLDLPDYENTNSYKMVRNMSLGQEAGGTNVLSNNTQAWLNTAAITSIQFIVGSNWAGGTVYVYGVK